MSKPSVTKSWATGRPKLPVPVPVRPAEPPEAAASPARPPAGGLATAADRAGAIAAEWAPAAGRILLGVVFAWFGYHELVQPDGWTQYVPFVSESSSLAVFLVLTHGWVLLVTGAALVAGIAPRAAAAVASRTDAGDRDRSGSDRPVSHGAARRRRARPGRLPDRRQAPASRPAELTETRRSSASAAHYRDAMTC